MLATVLQITVPCYWSPSGLVRSELLATAVAETEPGIEAEADQEADQRAENERKNEKKMKRK